MGDQKGFYEGVRNNAGVGGGGGGVPGDLCGLSRAGRTLGG